MIERHIEIKFIRQLQQRHHVVLITMHLERNFLFQNQQSVFHSLIELRHFLRIA